MTHDEMAAFFDRYMRAFEREDIDALLECYGPNCEITSPMFPSVRGTASIEASFQDVFRAFGDLTLRIDDVIVETQAGDGAVKAAVVVTAHARHKGEIFGLPGSGRRVETQMVFVFRVKDQRITSERRLYDFTGLLVQLGVLRTKHV
jgi:steroid delta-isomerase-like uncharacterized protein